MACTKLLQKEQERELKKPLQHYSLESACLDSRANRRGNQGDSVVYEIINFLKGENDE